MNPTLGGLERLRWEKKGLARDLLPRMNYQNVIQYIQPARAPDQPKEVPSHNVQLDWVYGYNAHSSKMNLFYSAKGALIYPAGSICIIHDSGAKTQNFFNVHTDVVICLKLYHTPEGNTIVASGECGQRPTIHIWEAETRNVLSSLKGFHRNGVMQVDFSPDRTKLATLGMDTYHSIAVYLWRTGERIFASRSTFEKVLDIRFISDELFATCG
jgi:WD40 repeat protein